MAPHAQTEPQRENQIKTGTKLRTAIVNTKTSICVCTCSDIFTSLYILFSVAKNVPRRFQD